MYIAQGRILVQLRCPAQLSCQPSVASTFTGGFAMQPRYPARLSCQPSVASTFTGGFAMQPRYPARLSCQPSVASTFTGGFAMQPRYPARLSCQPSVASTFQAALPCNRAVLRNCGLQKHEKTVTGYLNNSSFYRTLSKNGNPKLASLDSILHAVGLRFSVEPVTGTR